MRRFKSDIFKQSDSEPLFFNPFDYMVVRFIYTKPNAGVDLDLMVYYDGTGTIYDKEAVGFGQTPNTIKIPNDNTPDDDSYLWWATDDVNLPVGQCVEAVVIGVDNFVQNQVIVGNEINIKLRAGWYNAVGNGNVVVQLQTYLGGVMSKVGTNIINTGGTLVDNLSKSVLVTSGTNQVTELKSNLVGVVTYNKITKLATLT